MKRTVRKTNFNKNTDTDQTFLLVGVVAVRYKKHFPFGNVQYLLKKIGCELRIVYENNLRKCTKYLRNKGTVTHLTLDCDISPIYILEISLTLKCCWNRLVDY